MNILIADDEKSIANAISAILRHKSFTTHAVYDGKCAYEAACDMAFDAIILDIMMPYMDGIEVMQRIRANGDLTPILLLTAKSQIEDKIEGLTCGADDYMAKPFDSGELVARLCSMIRRSRMTHNDTLSIGGLKLLVSEKLICCKDTALSLSLGEAEIMRRLIIHAGKYIPLQFIAQSDDDSNDIDETLLYVNYLKDKLKSLRADVELIIDGKSGCELRMMK